MIVIQKFLIVGARVVKIVLQNIKPLILVGKFAMIIFFIFKCKGKGLDTCYSATYVSQTSDQQRFTISQVAADWHEPMVPQRIMWPSRANGQLDPRCS